MASCSAYMIMNGVMIPGVSAGSNQVGASEMWTPQVICPSGAARDGVGVSHVTAERSVASAARTHRFSNGADRLMVISSSRVASFGTSAQGKGTGTREWRDYRACATVRATRRCFMTRRTLLLALLAVIATAGAAVAEVCLSPWVKRLAGPEKYLYVYAVDADAKDNDFLAVVDVNLASPTYGPVKPELDRMITSSFTPLRNYMKPLAQWDMKDGGNTMLVWDFKERKVVQTLVTDPVPLEVRWSLKPGAAYGWTNSALGDSIWFFARTPAGSFTAKKAADLGKGCLPADLRQSPDDRYLYVSCFMRSEIQALDVSRAARQ